LVLALFFSSFVLWFHQPIAAIKENKTKQKKKANLPPFPKLYIIPYDDSLHFHPPYRYELSKGVGWLAVFIFFF
jgi:hypothetical protein